MKTIFLTLIVIFFTTGFSNAQSLFTYKIDYSPKERPKETLSQITSQFEFSSRKIDSNYYFIIESSVDFNEKYFEDLLLTMGKNLTLFEKNVSTINANSNNFHNKACCSITLDMDDSYGDGWTGGGQLTVTIDGTSSNYSASGSGTVVNVAYCDGQDLEISYTSGSYNGDNSYTITSPAGTLVSDASPSTGVVFISSNACSSTAQTPTQQDCDGSQIVCSNASFSGNSNGSGNYSDLSSSNDGCLNGENQTSWYYVNVASSGTLTMDIVPSNGSDDYDFAIWGPFTASNANANCPPTTSPVRCNFVQFPRTCSILGCWFSSCGTNTNPTGLALNASLPISNDACTNYPYLRHLDVTAGDIYIMVIDNFSGSSQPFDLNWGGSAGLDCTPISLPVDLISFDVEHIKNYNEISWTTASEKNNDYFILEYSSNGESWSEVKKISGAGNSSIENTYYTTHREFENGINYYRLTQIDFDGTLNTHDIISIDNTKNRVLLKKVNSMGQVVNDQYRGMVIEYYSDGYVKKVYQR